MRAALTTLGAISAFLSLIVAVAWADQEAVLLSSVVASGVFLAAAAGQAVRHSGWVAVVAAVTAVGVVVTVAIAIVAVLVGSALNDPEVN